MAYQIDRFNGQFLTVVEDGTINQNTSLKFVGKNYAGYGEIQNENFLHLLESFARNVPPERPLSGQVWFDSTPGAEKLKFYDGSQWKTTGGSEVSSSQPAGLTDGDFWWDTTTEQLYAKGSTGFVLVGPQATASGAVTQMKSARLADTAIPSTGHDVILSTIGDNVVAIFASETFSIATSDAIPGFSSIKPGINLINESGGITTTYKYHGTATSAEGLVVNGSFVNADEFLRQTGVSFEDAGFKVGSGLDSDPKLYVYINGQNAKIVQQKNSTTSSIDIAVRRSNFADIDAAKFVYSGINPGHSSSTLGTSTSPWLEVHAAEFKGTADKANGVQNPNPVSTVLSVQPSYLSLPETIALRDVNSDITARRFIGIATQASYADLAEKYTTGAEYSVGTVVAVCDHDEHEMDLATESSIVAGVVSDKPAYLMNAEAEGQAIALKGRVPVRVIGPVTKGQAVRASNNGVASTNSNGEIVGIALESNTDDGEKLVECFLKV